MILSIPGSGHFDALRVVDPSLSVYHLHNEIWYEPEKTIVFCHRMTTIIEVRRFLKLNRSSKIQVGCSTYCGLHYAFLIGPTLVIGGYRRGFEFVKFRIAERVGSKQWVAHKPSLTVSG